MEVEPWPNNMRYKKEVLNIGNVFASTLSTCEKHFEYLMEIAWEFVGNTLGTIFTNDLRIHSFEGREVIRSQEDTCISEHVDSHQPTPNTCLMAWHNFTNASLRTWLS
jgi:hypothetical protein